MNIIGISAYYHDSAAALIRDGRVIAAAQEERFTRKKFDSGFPSNALRFCLEQADIKPVDIQHVVFYDKPFLKFERLLETYVNFAPRGYRSFAMAIPLWLSEKLFLKRLLAKELSKVEREICWTDKLLFSEHHLSHAASAFYPSGFDAAAILTMDGVGEWATTSLSMGHGNSISMRKEIPFPHSLGLLYSAFTYYAGFKVNSGEYKLMGLAPYGSPKYVDRILGRIVDVKEDGSFRLDQQYFNYCTGLTMTSPMFHELFEGDPRAPDEPLTQRHMDVAASIQAVTEEIVLRLTASIADETGAENLCLAGGVALNCVANGKVRRAGRFRRIWIQPAAGDSGGALGAALAAYHLQLGGDRRVETPDAMSGGYLGPSFDDDEIARRLQAQAAHFERIDEGTLMRFCAEDLAAGRAVGWFQGRMEFGPRALGARSILGDARSPTMQSLLNLKVKYRESFRPFAPAVLREFVHEWFELDEDSPYMLLVADVAKRRQRSMTDAESLLFGIDKLNVPRSEIPAVTHVDYSARIQTVHRETNPRFHRLIEVFRGITGCPVLVNTSFNVRGEPIVCTPEDAFRCFMGTGIERLAVGNCYLRKEDQDSTLQREYQSTLEPD